jgi:hypothetical protein
MLLSITKRYAQGVCAFPLALGLRLRQRVGAMMWAKRPDLALVATDSEVEQMTRDLVRRFGSRRTAQLLGCGVRSVWRWMTGYTGTSGAARRAIWLTWCRYFDPERAATEYHVLTWGRYAVKPEEDVPQSQGIERGAGQDKP